MSRSIMIRILVLALCFLAACAETVIKIDSVTPDEGHRGALITLTGKNLDERQLIRVGGGVVELEGERDAMAQGNEEVITFRIPETASGGAVQIELPEGEVGAARIDFTVLDREPLAWQAVAVGLGRACAISTDARLFCWGRAPGDGFALATHAPVEVMVATGWDQVASRGVNTCARDGDGVLWCWGDDQPTPRAIDGQWDVWALGYGMVCGDDTCHFFEDVNVASTDPALIHRTSRTWLQFTFAGSWYRDPICGVSTEHELWCKRFQDDAGWQQFGADQAWRAVTRATGPLADFVCALTTKGDLWCVGRGPVTTDGKLLTEYPFMQLEPAGGWSRVEAGSEAACGIREGGLYCWGLNTNGVRTADVLDYATVHPERIGGEGDWRDVSVGPTGACAVKDDGSLWCWGQTRLPGDDTRNHGQPYRIDVP